MKSKCFAIVVSLSLFSCGQLINNSGGTIVSDCIESFDTQDLKISSSSLNSDDALFDSVSTESSSETSLSLSKEGEDSSAVSEEDEDGSVIIATWNIGHFSCGTSIYPPISFDETMENDYRETIENISADIIAITEYSVLPSADPEEEQSSNMAVFSSFEHSYEFEQRQYCCNAFFSDRFIRNATIQSFDCNDGMVLSSGLEAGDYYYVTGEVSILGIPSLIVLVHCAFDSNNPDITFNQYQELATKLDSDENVVILGDFNNGFANGDIDVFSDYGYSLANSFGTNHFSTFHSAACDNNEIDNIIVKGFVIDNVEMIETDLSDHNILFCSLSKETDF